jgi:trigger factor
LAEAAEAEAQVLMDEKGLSVLVAETTDFPFPGAAVHLLGISAGEERDAEFTFPADYRNEALRGRRAAFHFVCQGVKSRTVPEWSDDVARAMGEFDDLADLRAKVRQSLEAQSRSRADAEYADKVIDAIVAGSKIVFPPVLLHQEVDETLADLDRRLKDQHLSLADYLKIEKKEVAELRTELEPQARRRLERALVLGRVVEDEGLAVDETEVEAALDRVLEPLGDSTEAVRRALDTPAGRRRIRLDLLTDKAVARLVQIARGEAPERGASSRSAEAEATAAEAAPLQGDPAHQGEGDS